MSISQRILKLEKTANLTNLIVGEFSILLHGISQKDDDAFGVLIGSKYTPLTREEFEERVSLMKKDLS